jgi:hypothetical protein
MTKIEKKNDSKSQNSRSDDQHFCTVYVLIRVVNRLNSEFCIPLFLGFDSGLHNKNTLQRVGKKNDVISRYFYLTKFDEMTKKHHKYHH